MSAEKILQAGDPEASEDSGWCSSLYLEGDGRFSKSKRILRALYQVRLYFKGVLAIQKKSVDLRRERP